MCPAKYQANCYPVVVDYIMSFTIYGKVDWTTNKVYFGDPTDPCNEPHPCFTEVLDDTCIIRDGGEHDGMVQLTISGHWEDCNDTYYGCVDWTTGKFKVFLPDDCCGPCSSICTQTPYYITLTLSGMNSCSSDCFWGSHPGIPGTNSWKPFNFEVYNGTYVLENIGTQYIPTGECAGNCCLWQWPGTKTGGYRKWYYDYYCQNYADSDDCDLTNITVLVRSGGMVCAYLDWVFVGHKARSSECANVSGIPNDYDCETSTYGTCAEGGTVTIQDGDQT